MSVKIIHGDCRDVLAGMEPESFDCVVADPPYGETSLAWDHWPRGWLQAVLRVLKPTGSLWSFDSARMFHEHANEFSGWKFAQDIVWEKQNGSGFHSDRFKRVHESAWQFYKAGAPWGDVYKLPQYTNDATARVTRRKTRPTHMGVIEGQVYTSEDGGPRLARSVIYCRNEHGRAVHPTQKPLDLVLPLLRYACPVGGHVLDPFAGSGTTALAAKEMGAHATIIEANPKYIDIARRRIEGDAPLFAEVGT